MTMGGSGFATLIQGNFRLAYLQCSWRPNQFDLGFGPPSKYQDFFSFYELWNHHPVWEGVRGSHGSILEGLVTGLHDGSISMRKTIRSPNGKVVVRDYETMGCQIKVLWDEGFVPNLALPRVLRITGPTDDHLVTTLNQEKSS